MSKRKCKNCGDPFTQSRPMQDACNYRCAIELARSRREERERKQRRERKRNLAGRQDWIKKAQQAFNAWIRYRDRTLPCISCGRYHDGQWHAGHYRTTKAQPALRFHELNAHRQCQPCNTHLSGDLVRYRVNLLDKIGADAMEFLERDHGTKRWTIEELKGITDEYRSRLREAQRDE